MERGMMGLGRMGANMAQRLTRAGHEVVGYARHWETVQRVMDEGAIGRGAHSPEELVSMLTPPRVVWLMVPAASVDATLALLTPLLSEGDTVVDGGNSFYRDDIRRAKELRDKGFHYLDVGTSGGVWGLERGYCLMIGGEPEAAERLDPIFATLAPGVAAASRTPGREGAGGTAEQGYLLCGPNGAGHFVKMVHNGIEYGIMAAYAEGLNVLRNADIGNRQAEVDAETAPLADPDAYRYELDLKEIAELWRRGTVIASWLLDLTAAALLKRPALEEFDGRVSDSGEGRWTLQAAVDEGVPAHVLSAALFERFSSRGHAEFADRLLSAMRFEFGGHREKRGSEAGEAASGGTGS
jgi:6-phosphogluconate dehydrogenase